MSRSSGLAVVRLARVADGEILRFQILLPGNRFLNGCSRWMPDGSAIALTWIVGALSGIFVQDFLPSKDIPDKRRPLVEFGHGGLAESFAPSPTGKRATVSNLVRSWNLMSAENLAGVTRPSR